MQTSLKMLTLPCYEHNYFSICANSPTHQIQETSWKMSICASWFAHISPSMFCLNVQGHKVGYQIDIVLVSCRIQWVRLSKYRRFKVPLPVRAFIPHYLLAISLHDLEYNTLQRDRTGHVAFLTVHPLPLLDMMPFKLFEKQHGRMNGVGNERVSCTHKTKLISIIDEQSVPTQSFRNNFRFTRRRLPLSTVNKSCAGRWRFSELTNEHHLPTCRRN